MQQTLREPLVAAGVFERHAAPVRPSEWILLAYFVNTAIMALWHGLALQIQAAAVLVPVAVWILARLETRSGRPWSSVTRDWAPLGLVLLAYWQADWFSGEPLEHWERTWLEWDRTILSTWGLRGWIESAGALLPSLLEFSYLVLYAVPAMCLGLVHLHGRHGRVDRFLQVFLLGTLGAYALLPHFPTVAPRVVFDGVDLPSLLVPLRSVNLWVLSRWDISTSVFPSGHVAAGFAAAFGLWRAIPERRWLSGLAFLQALLVLLATVYGRYHYAADGIAGAAVSTLAFLAVEAAAAHG